MIRTSSASTRSACCRSTRCRRRTPGIRGCRWARRRWPTSCGRATCATIPRNPAWPDRDRFVLSAGHASMLLYSLLFLTGYDLTLDDLEHFRQWGSRTPGHPERGRTPGVEVTTGPLGQGFGNASGWRSRSAGSRRPSIGTAHDVVDHYTYVLASDGDLMEGRRLRGGVARRRPAARSADRPLRRQPDHALGDDEPDVLGGRRRALRGLRLARAADRRAGRRGRGRGADRGARRGGSAVADRGAHAHRLRQPAQAGHLARARRAARRRGGAPDQARARLARGPPLLRARRGAARVPKRRRAGRRPGGGVAAPRGRLRRRPSRPGRPVRARAGGRAARRMGGAPAGLHAGGRRDGDARRRRERHQRAGRRRAEPRRRLGGPRSVDAHGDDRMRRLREPAVARRPADRCRRRARPAACGATRDGTSTSAFASTPWPPP